MLITAPLSQASSEATSRMHYAGESKRRDKRGPPTHAQLPFEAMETGRVQGPASFRLNGLNDGPQKRGRGETRSGVAAQTRRTAQSLPPPLEVHEAGPVDLLDSDSDKEEARSAAKAAPKAVAAERTVRTRSGRNTTIVTSLDSRLGVRPCDSLHVQAFAFDLLAASYSDTAIRRSSMYSPCSQTTKCKFPT